MSLDCVEVLADVKEVDWNVKDTYNGGTGLMRAAYSYMNDCLKILKAKDVNIDWNIQNDYGNTAVMIAALRSNVEFLEIMKDVPGVDWNIKNNYGDSALTLVLYRIDSNWFKKDFIEDDNWMDMYDDDKNLSCKKTRLEVLEILLYVPNLVVHVQDLNYIKDVHEKAIAFCRMHVGDKMTQTEGETVTEVVFALLNNFNKNIINILLSDVTAVEECRTYVAQNMSERSSKEENVTELVFALKNNMDAIAQVLIDAPSNRDIICLVLTYHYNQP